jgi:hypothetical protein
MAANQQTSQAPADNAKDIKDNKTTSSKKLVTGEVNDPISKGSTMVGKTPENPSGKPDQIDINPMQNENILSQLNAIYDRVLSELDTHLRDDGTTSLTNIYKKNTPGEVVNSKFALQFKNPKNDTEAASRSGNPARKEMDIVRRNDANADRKTDSAYYRHQSIVKNVIDESIIRHKVYGFAIGSSKNKAHTFTSKESADRKAADVKDRQSYLKVSVIKKFPHTKDETLAKHHHVIVSNVRRLDVEGENQIDEKYGPGYVSPANKIEKAMKKTRGIQPNSSDKYRQEMEKNSAAYQAILDREAAAKNKTNEEVLGCDIDELTEEELGFTEENFIPSGNELYEDWNELEEEAEYQGRKVKLGKPFLTPGGPKKRSVYVKNEGGNVVKVNFGDPNMTIKKDIPARRKSFRARHHCDTNPGPRTKARYWSCRAW